MLSFLSLSDDRVRDLEAEIRKLLQSAEDDSDEVSPVQYYAVKALYIR